MQVNGIRAYNYSGIKKSISFGEIDGMTPLPIESSYISLESNSRQKNTYVNNIRVPKNFDKAKLDVFIYSPKKDKYVKCGAFEAKLPDELK